MDELTFCCAQRRTNCRRVDVDGREMSIEADAMLQESDIEGSYGTNPNEGKKMYNHR